MKIEDKGCYVVIRCNFKELLQIDGPEYMVSDRVHVCPDVFAEANRKAYLKEHGEALLYSLGWEV